MAVAARRVQRPDYDPNAGSKSLLSRLWGLFIYVVAVALGVVVVLALMSPKQPVTEPPSIPNPPALIARLIAGSRYTPATVSQQVINGFLKSSAGVALKPPSDLIPDLLWPKPAGSRVELGNGTVTFFLQVTLLNHPFYFSESFSLDGSARQWRLEPESGSIGLLTLPGPFLRLISPLVKASSAPLAPQLKVLEEAESLQLRAGYLEFTTR